MIRSVRILLLSMCLILLFLISGCSDDINIETDIDSEAEPNEYIDLYEADLSGLFDSREDTTSAEESSVVFYKREEDSSEESVTHEINVNETVDSADNLTDRSSPEVSDEDELGSAPVVAVVDESMNNNGTIQNRNNLPESSPEADSEINNVDDTSVDFENAAYILNKNTKKFHYPYCGSAKQIKEKNKAVGNDRDDIIARGFKPCKRCNP